MTTLRLILPALLLAAGVTGCPAYEVYRMMKVRADLAEGYRAYCAEHVQECVDAYNRAQLDVYLNRTK
jgi:hypothetical protein